MTGETIASVGQPADGIVIRPAMIGEGAGAILALAGVVALVAKGLQTPIKRDISDVAKDIASAQHDLKNTNAKIQSLHAAHTDVVQRVVKLELSTANIERSQERIEARIEKNHEEIMNHISTWTEQFAASIREVRVVTPRN